MYYNHTSAHKLVMFRRLDYTHINCPNLCHWHLEIIIAQLDM